MGLYKTAASFAAQTIDVVLDRKKQGAIFPPGISEGVTTANVVVIDRYEEYLE